MNCQPIQSSLFGPFCTPNVFECIQYNPLFVLQTLMIKHLSAVVVAWLQKHAHCGPTKKESMILAEVFLKNSRNLWRLKGCYKVKETFDVTAKHPTMKRCLLWTKMNGKCSDRSLYSACITLFSIKELYLLRYTM